MITHKSKMQKHLKNKQSFRQTDLQLNSNVLFFSFFFYFIGVPGHQIPSTFILVLAKIIDVLKSSIWIPQNRYREHIPVEDLNPNRV